MLRRGLLAGFGLATLAIGSAAFTDKAAASTVSPDINEPAWLWCYKCQGLFYGPYIGSSRCPAGGHHDITESLIYDLAYNVSGGAGFQSDWLWCNKCQGLFYGPFVSASACPAGGLHNGDGSGNYVLGLNSDKAVPDTGVYQSYWLWCSKCQVLFFGYGSHEADSKCPRGDAHNGDESGDYNVAVTTTGSPVASEMPRTFQTDTAAGRPPRVVFRQRSRPLAESFNAAVKVEPIRRTLYPTCEKARDDGRATSMSVITCSVFIRGSATGLLR